MAKERGREEKEEWIEREKIHGRKRGMERGRELRKEEMVER